MSPGAIFSVAKVNKPRNVYCVIKLFLFVTRTRRIPSLTHRHNILRRASQSVDPNSNGVEESQCDTHLIAILGFFSPFLPHFFQRDLRPIFLLSGWQILRQGRGTEEEKDEEE